jgi:hypothetical protein
MAALGCSLVQCGGPDVGFLLISRRFFGAILQLENFCNRPTADLQLRAHRIGNARIDCCGAPGLMKLAVFIMANGKTY